MQAVVPPGCTHLVQVTDTGFAQPAKAACTAEHEHQRRMLKLKARQEKTKPVYKRGPAEVARAAQAMHQKMVAISADREQVLAEARACGWLHYRPNRTGSLELAEKQAWAAKHSEGPVVWALAFASSETVGSRQVLSSQ